MVISITKKIATTNLVKPRRIHPVTSAASSFLNDHISSRFPDDLLREHYPLTSRGDLVLFQRYRIFWCKLSSLCVYNPLSGHCTFFSDPPGVASNLNLWFPMYILLTAADGIDCSFNVFVLYHVTVPDQSYTIEIHTATSTSNTWTPTITSHNSRFFSQDIYKNIVVLRRCHLLFLYLFVCRLIHR
jgi:hypothetical protein